MRCNKPSIPLNSYMTSRAKVFYDNNYVVFFSCKPGFFLRGGKPSITCIHSKWSKAEFICAGLLIAVYYKVSYKPMFWIHSIILYFVSNYFRYIAPKCKPPHIPTNAYITFPRGIRGPYLENDEVFFSCKRGYYLTGNPSIQCKDGWTSIKFKCNREYLNKGHIHHPFTVYIA